MPEESGFPYIVDKGKVLAEYSGVTGSSREFTFIYAGDQRIAMIDKEGKLHFYLNDHLGSARLVIDTTGTVKDNYDYYAFGEALGQTISTGQSYRYTGGAGRPQLACPPWAGRRCACGVLWVPYDDETRCVSLRAEAWCCPPEVRLWRMT